MRMADVGTGSGAIALALAANRPEVEIWATDTNEKAVELARATHETRGGRPRTCPARRSPGPVPFPVDLIVANLPYLPEREHDSRYDDEPADAIYAPGDGLEPYRRLLDACREGRLVTRAARSCSSSTGSRLAADCWQLEDSALQLEDAA